MNLLIDDIIDDNVSEKKLLRLTKEDRRTILSTIWYRFKSEKQKSEKMKLAFIIIKLKRLFN